MANSEHQVGVVCSTDIVGMFGNSSDATLIYKRAGFRVLGTEIVAMPMQKYKLREAVRGNIETPNIVGVHGRLGSRSIVDHSKGPVDWAVVQLADLLLPGIYDQTIGTEVFDVPLLVEFLGQRTGNPVYYNIHNDEAAKRMSQYTEWGKDIKYSQLAIENGVNSGDIQQTLDLVDQYRQLKAVATIGTLDFVHAVVGLGGDCQIENVRKWWGIVLDYLDKNDDIFRQVHIPVGINRHDSLPWEEMRNETGMLADMCQVINSTGVRIIFENQANLLLGYGSQNKAIERLKMVRSDLQDSGLNV